MATLLAKVEPLDLLPGATIDTSQWTKHCLTFFIVMGSCVATTSVRRVHGVVVLGIIVWEPALAPQMVCASSKSIVRERSYGQQIRTYLYA